MAWSNNGRPIDLAAQDQAGFCLRFQQRVFPGSPVTYYDCARAAWDNSVQHPGEYPDNTAIVPISYSWVGTIGGTTKDWGHAAVWVPGRGVLSSPGSGYGQQWFGSIDELARAWNLRYLGWTEDVGGFRVVDYVADPTPSPEPAPTPSPEVRSHTIVPGDTLWDLAALYYGDGTRYMDIFNASNFSSGNPSLIYPGELAIIP
jgi:hypothetical protein